MLEPQRGTRGSTLPSETGHLGRMEVRVALDPGRSFVCFFFFVFVIVFCFLKTFLNRVKS